MQVLKIGTRDSQLALWQAETVKNLLEQQGYSAKLVPVKSEGDLDLTTPLYAMGVQGVFTRSLDIALLKNEIDIAVHSMKDVPVQLPQGIVQAAVLPRASHEDILVVNTGYLSTSTGFSEKEVFENITQILKEKTLTIGTSSIRRKAQWQAQYPHHHFENLRGNVNTRLRKLSESEWAGAVFAAAGLERIGVRPVYSMNLDWMLPAPAQGAILIVTHKANTTARKACALLNDADTDLATRVERDFLKALLGGCATPISALATVTATHILLKGNITLPDGSQQVNVQEQFPITAAANAGTIAAEKILQQGGRSLMKRLQDAP